MGCDITAHLEIKVNGNWEHLNCPYVWRNYELFAHLAPFGRQTGIAPVAEAKGEIPEDSSFLTRNDYEADEDKQVVSWLDRSELEILSDRWREFWRSRWPDEDYKSIERYFGWILGFDLHEIPNQRGPMYISDAFDFLVRLGD